MRIGILSFQTRNFENYDTVNQLADRVEANGHEATIIRVAELELRFGSKTEVLLKGEPLPLFDVMIVRPRIVADPAIPITLMRAIEAKGQLLVNGPVPIFATKNKLENLRQLSDAGISVPNTSVINMIEELDTVMVNFLYPVVVKTPFGSHGTGVFIAESERSLRPIIDFHLSRGHYNDPIIIQEFFNEANGSDIRAFVVGNKVVAAMQRTAPKGDFRANYSGGGSIKEITLTPEQEKLAIDATRILGMDYSGVDIINTNSGPVILEVNSNPGFKGIEEATGIDVANEIVKYSIAQVAK